MYIHQNCDWPDFRFDEETVRPIEEQLIEMRGFLSGLLSVSEGNGIIGDAIADSLCSSWEIEGISLPKAEIHSSTARRLGVLSIAAEADRRFDGIVDALFDAIQNHGPLTIERILSWQKRIVAEDPGVKKGAFRDGPVYIVSGGMKEPRIIYEAPPASEVHAMMSRFIESVNDHSCSDFALSAAAHFHFVAIHPFEDGNGRTARMISDYILHRSAQDIPMAFVSNELLKRRREYYAVLDRTSRSDSLDITEWICWFLERLMDAYADAIARIHRSFAIRSFYARMKERDLNDRQRKFLERVLRDDWTGPLTAKKYAVIVSCHVDTANRDLKKLVANGFIIKEDGGSKNTHYSLLI